MNIESFKGYIHTASTFSSTYLSILLLFCYMFMNQVQRLYTLNLSYIKTRGPIETTSVGTSKGSHKTCRYAYDLSPYQISRVQIRWFNTYNLWNGKL